MNPRRMRAADKKICRWVGFGVTKGVTSPRRHISLIALPLTLKRSLHGELIRGFKYTDSPPLCYDLLHHVHGFDDFIRWVYFSDPYGGNDVLGIDWDINMRPTSGIATSMLVVRKIILILGAHGIPASVEVALLNPRMVEDLRTTMMRRASGLETMSDWVGRGQSLLGPGTNMCPRCGTLGLAESDVYCPRCGCKPEFFWKGDR
ncbi:MAG: hypothetical protein Q7R79_01450 [bacterium]|nr:hypothetical protein [bacterium]